MTQLQTPMSDQDGSDEPRIRRIQSATLRQMNETHIIRATKAIRETGVEGGYFEFYPEAVDRNGMVAAFATEDAGEGQDPLTRSVYREGEDGKTLSVGFPVAALEKLGIDVDQIDWEDPPRFDVYAGPETLAFEHIKEISFGLDVDSRDD